MSRSPRSRRHGDGNPDPPPGAARPAGGSAILTTHQPLRPLRCPLRTLRLGGDAGGGQ
ncbi:hypothetical protein LNP17_17860 [Klebsiella variicola subsp. variicola]|nr:hypothetical protein [Klebsiella variicola subsp. variicola]